MSEDSHTEFDYIGFGKRLAIWRMQAGMSQTGLAELADISKSAVSQIERGTTEARPKDSTLFKLAKALHITVEVLLDADPVEYQRSVEAAPESAAVVHFPSATAGRAPEASPREHVSAALPLGGDRRETIQVMRMRAAPSDTPEYVVFWRHSYLNALGDYNPDTLRCWTVDSDAMAPTLRRGDTIIVHTPAKETTTFSGCGIYMIDAASGNVVPRRVSKTVRGTLIVSCDNSLYREAETEYSVAELPMVGHCVLVIRCEKL